MKKGVKRAMLHLGGEGAQLPITDGWGNEIAKRIEKEKNPSKKRFGGGSREKNLRGFHNGGQEERKLSKKKSLAAELRGTNLGECEKTAKAKNKHINRCCRKR